MNITSWTFDLLQLIYLILIILLLAGVIPFTAMGVGAVLLVGVCEFKIEVGRS